MTILFPDKPCKDECMFNDEINDRDSLCLRCATSPYEKRLLASVDAYKRNELYYLINMRRIEMWLIWSELHEPTIH
jgi:hypothetical protein